MVDEEKVDRIFASIVNERGKNIAVYGLGKYAGIVGRHFADAIVCFCDEKQQDGEFFARPIKPLQVLPKLGIKTIVIATSRQSERIVYERIVTFCREAGIKIYSIQSGDLSEVGRDLSLDFFGKKLKERLWNCIKCHDVVSFDIFDTLLMRKTLYPMDVFDIVEYRAVKKGVGLPKGFKNYRNQAEVALEREKIGLDGIYENLKKMLNLSDEEIYVLKKLEMDVEQEVLMPRLNIVEAGRYAKSLGKKVLLVSDMYLSPNFLENVLCKRGIDFYDKIYVSDYYGTSKGEGLFDIVRRENPACTYMHIGDNLDVDGWGARRKGIDSFTVKSAVEIFKSSGGSQPFKYLEGYNERLILGLFLAKAYANPFVLDEKGKRQVMGINDFAGLFIAPLAISFVVWLIGKVREQNFEAVLFASRDGYAFKKMYDKAMSVWHLSNMPPSIYLHLSRKLCMGLAMKETQDLEWMRSRLQGQIRNFVNNVFQLGITQSKERDDDSKEVWEEVLSKKEDIYRGSKERKRRYRKYVQKIGLSAEGKYVFVDMCSQGTSQGALHENVFTNLYGLYFKRYSAKDFRTMGRVESFLPQDSHIMLLNNVFEFIFSSPESSVNDVDDFGNIVFNEEMRSNKEIVECRNAQTVVMEVWCEFLKLAIPMENTGRLVGQQILELYRNEMFTEGIEVFRRRAINDDLGGGEAPCLKEDEKELS